MQAQSREERPVNLVYEDIFMNKIEKP